jgi:hypothetical protein
VLHIGQRGLIDNSGQTDRSRKRLKTLSYTTDELSGGQHRARAVGADSEAQRPCQPGEDLGHVKNTRVDFRDFAARLPLPFLHFFHAESFYFTPFS